MRTKMLGLAAALAGGLGMMATSAATTATAAPFGAGLASGPDRLLVERVADGCGPGFHANPWGRCRPNDRGWGYGPPRGAYGPPRASGYERGYDRGYDRPRRPYGGY